MLEEPAVEVEKASPSSPQTPTNCNSSRDRLSADPEALTGRYSSSQGLRSFRDISVFCASRRLVRSLSDFPERLANSA